MYALVVYDLCSYLCSIAICSIMLCPEWTHVMKTVFPNTVIRLHPNCIMKTSDMTELSVSLKLLCHNSYALQILTYL
jgi:hypothetical protein